MPVRLAAEQHDGGGPARGNRASNLQPGSSAPALVFEHRWMAPVREAIIESGGPLLADLCSVAQRQHEKAQATAEQHTPPNAPTAEPTASAPTPPQPAAPPSPETTLAELERLVALKQQGLTG